MFIYYDLFMSLGFWRYIDLIFKSLDDFGIN